MPQHGKTKKALLRRFKFTRTGKMMHQPPSQNHFLAKKSGNQTRAKRTETDFPILAKTLKKSIAA